MRCALVALAMALSAMPTAAGAAERIVVSNWEGYLPPDLLERFTAATGIAAELVLHASNEEIAGKLADADGAGIDVAFVAGPFAESLASRGLTAAIDHGKVPNLANLYPEASELAYDPGNTHSVPYAWGTSGLCYRADRVERPPFRWMDLLRPPEGLKGRVILLGEPRWLMAAGLKALGFSLNSTDPGEIRAARRLLLEARPSLLGIDDSAFYTRLVAGEADLAQAWDGWCNYGIDKNPEIKFAIPLGGSDLWVDAMVIPAASDAKDAAHAFIDFALRAETGLWVAETILYKVPNRAAMERLDPALYQRYPNLAMTPAQLLTQEPMRDIGAAAEAYAKAAAEISAAR